MRFKIDWNDGIRKDGQDCPIGRAIGAESNGLWVGRSYLYRFEDDKFRIVNWPMNIRRAITCLDYNEPNHEPWPEEVTLSAECFMI